MKMARRGCCAGYDRRGVEKGDSWNGKVKGRTGKTPGSGEDGKSEVKMGLMKDKVHCLSSPIYGMGEIMMVIVKVR